jgi:hypothetical protein
VNNFTRYGGGRNQGKTSSRSGAGGASSRVSVSCEVKRETDKAWLIYDGKIEVWYPKSQGEVYRRKDGTYDLFGEEWLMKEKGLI